MSHFEVLSHVDGMRTGVILCPLQSSIASFVDVQGVLATRSSSLCSYYTSGGPNELSYNNPDL